MKSSQKKIIDLTPEPKKKLESGLRVSVARKLWDVCRGMHTCYAKSRRGWDWKMCRVEITRKWTLKVFKFWHRACAPRSLCVIRLSERGDACLCVCVSYSTVSVRHCPTWILMWRIISRCTCGTNSDGRGGRHVFQIALQLYNWWRTTCMRQHLMIFGAPGVVHRCLDDC